MVAINGTDLDIRVEGRDGAPAVVLGHSILTDLSAWDEVAAALAPDYRVIRYDQRGHGGSAPAPAPYSLELLAADAAGILDHLGIARAHFVGLSLSGGVGIMLVLTRPERLLSLTVAASGPRTPPQMQATWDERVAAVRAGGIETQVEGFVGRWFTPEAPAAVQERAAAMIRRASREGFAGAAEAVKGTDLLGRLGEITVPTLVIVGEADAGASPAVGQLIADRIPGARLEIIPGAAHQVAMEQPERFIAALKPHLAAQSR